MRIFEDYKRAVRAIRAMDPIPMRKASAQLIPAAPGVYAVSDHSIVGAPVVYVGCTTTGNLRSRLTSYHLSGALASARIKAGLVRCGICADNADARAYVEKNCRARFVTVPDATTRRFMEHFLIAYFTPKLNA